MDFQFDQVIEERRASLLNAAFKSLALFKASSTLATIAVPGDKLSPAGSAEYLAVT